MSDRKFEETIKAVIEYRKDIHGHLRPHEKLEVVETGQGYLNIVASCLVYDSNGNVKVVSKSHTMDIERFSCDRLDMMGLQARDVWVDELIDNIIGHLRNFSGSWD